MAFTTDAGLQWTPRWSGSAAGDKLFAQIVRWSMRPSGGSGRLTATFEPLEDKMRVVVTALDDKNEFLNFLTMTGTAVGPDLKKPLDLEIEQTAPGRYVGTFPVHEPGSYFVTINPGRGMTPLRTGVSVPYSDEFRDREANDALLTQLAAVQPKDGPPGQLIEDQAVEQVRDRQTAGVQYFSPRPAQGHQQPGGLALADPHCRLRLSGRRLHPPRERELRLAAAALGPVGRFRPPPSAGAGPAAVHRASEESQGGGGRAPGAAPRGDAFRTARPSGGDVKALDELAPPGDCRTSSGRALAGGGEEGRRDVYRAVAEGEEEGMGGEERVKHYIELQERHRGRLVRSIEAGSGEYPQGARRIGTERKLR